MNRYKVRRTGAPDSHHPVLTPWTSRKAALLLSQAVCNPHQWSGGTVRQHSSCLHRSITAAIRCQQLMSAPSTSALGMASPKPSPAPWEVLLQQLTLLAPLPPSQMACPALLLEKPFHTTLLSVYTASRKQLIIPALPPADSPDRMDLCYCPFFQG